MAAMSMKNAHPGAIWKPTEGASLCLTGIVRKSSVFQAQGFVRIGRTYFILTYLLITRSFSDYRRIVFNLNLVIEFPKPFKDSRRNEWRQFGHVLELNFPVVLFVAT